LRNCRASIGAIGFPGAFPEQEATRTRMVKAKIVVFMSVKG
jgi:hypothetical protein